jgi:hypothetical protein
MRYLIALMAILGLLASPVAAAAAQVACDQSQAMSQMDHGSGVAAMPAMGKQATPSANKAGGDPCCDHPAGSKMDDKGCALACASVCAPIAALPYAPFSLALAYTRAPAVAAKPVWVKPYDPLGLERPPKSIA